MTAGLITKLKKLAELAKESQVKEMYGGSWALEGQQGRDPRQTEIARLLIEAEDDGPDSCGEVMGK